jgi:hypothetical protein
MVAIFSPTAIPTLTMDTIVAVGFVVALGICVAIVIALWPGQNQAKAPVLHFRPPQSKPPIQSQIVVKPFAPMPATPMLTPMPPTRITTADLREIDWYQFEKVIAFLYESRGNRVERRGGANPDGGIDMVLVKEGKRAAVQVKQWLAWKIGVRQMREFFGGMKAEGFEYGIFVLISECTREAREFARQNAIKIVDGDDIDDMLAEADPLALAQVRRVIDDPVKHCPKCGAPMVKRPGSGFYAGSHFWGCTRFPRCRGKIKIAGGGVDID